MKQYLPAVLALVCAVLVAAIIVVKHGDNARHETDAGAIADFSNRLDSAHMDVLVSKGAMLTFSNNLDEARSASVTYSNQLMEAQSAVALDTGEITNLTRQLADAESENGALNQRIADLNGQMDSQVAVLKSQLALTQTNLAQMTKGCYLLEDRFRRDVAERVVAERKFNNLSELQAQMKYLKDNPAKTITAEGILAGLDIVVKSNVFYVYSPD